MFGKHYDTRVSQNFVHTYTRVPYLDTEIFNIEVQGLKESRRTRDRTCRVIESLERTKEKSERLSDNLNSSRRRREEEGKKFIDSLLETQTTRLEKEKSTMQEYSDEKQKSRFDYLKDQKYLSDLMSTNASKAASRITSVRRWH